MFTFSPLSRLPAVCRCVRRLSGVLLYGGRARIPERAAILSGAVLGAAAMAQGQTVVINEIHYDEDDPTVHSEFIELHNPDSRPLDLSGYYFSSGIALTFPAGAVLPAGGHVVVCEDPAVLQARFGKSGAGIFSWNAGTPAPAYGQLKNGGETLSLRAPGGVLADEVTYGRGFPWPTVGDPPNYSIELIHPSLDNNSGGSWRRSDGGGGDRPPVVYVPPGSPGWHYRKALSEASVPAEAWRFPAFEEDGTWVEGRTPAGYGETVATLLTDMQPAPPEQPGYSGIYLRHAFDLTGPVPGTLRLRVFNDDGFIAWLNGVEVARFGPPAGEVVPYNAWAGRNHEHTVPDEVLIPAPNALLHTGTAEQPGKNILAIHALNTSASSSDFYIDAELGFTGAANGGAPTPMAMNTVFSENAPPAVSQVTHGPVYGGPAPIPPPMWIPSGLPVRVTARITDPQGTGSVQLHYQPVVPGSYIKLTDPRYGEPDAWLVEPMSDDGLNGDAVAEDGIFTATVPAQVQQHRHLIRYRITAADTGGALVRAPYGDDPQPNFAWFVYDGIPDYTARATPSSRPVTYPGSLLDRVPAYHLITTLEEHGDAQNVEVPDPAGTPRLPMAGAYGHSLYNWHGALCYNGRVYDHIRFRARGGVWRFAMGKNMWKFDFNKGHDFRAADNYGQEYGQPWKKLNFSACIQQADTGQRGEQGLFESVGFRLFQLSGMPAEHTSFAHFRIISRPSETNDTESQFDDDFQGLYLAVEQQDGQFLDEHDLPDGNLYKMESGTGELNHTGRLGPKNKSDLNAFMNYGTTETWWRANCDLPNYYNYRAIIDCIHHYDIGDGKNYFFYRNPGTERWTALAWDLDLTWADNVYRADNGIAGLSPSSNSTEPFFSRVFGATPTGPGPIPALRQEMRNRVREIQDLLFTPEQTGMLIDEMASFIYQPGQPSFVDADRAMWDYNPIMVSPTVNPSKSGQGRFYQAAVNDQATPADETRTFAGMTVRMKSYINSRRAVIASQILTAAGEALVPATPVLTRADAGAGAMPVNALTFSSSPFSGRNGAAFAGLKWRIAEATDPAAPGYQPYSRNRRAYEMENAWESEILTTWPAVLTAPAVAARPGGSYRARVKHLDAAGRWSHWSPPVTFLAAEPDLTPWLKGLVISAVNYHPAAPSATEAEVNPDPEAYEWIELMNTGPVSLDLSSVRFTKGIDFDFAGSAVTVLQPGQRVLVVRNVAAFTVRYGATPGGTAVAGQWQEGDALSNAGEQLKLSYGAGTAIRDFVYDDNPPWPEEADGGGYALVLVDPESVPDPAEPENWRRSTQPGGSPGQTDRMSFAAWAAALGHAAAGGMQGDPDGDGVLNFVEYALGTAPDSGVSRPGVTAGWEAGPADGEEPDDNPERRSRITWLRRTDAQDVQVIPEISRDGVRWTAAAPEFVRQPPAARPDGLTEEVFLSAEPVPADYRIFFRLRLVAGP